MKAKKKNSETAYAKSRKNKTDAEKIADLTEQFLSLVDEEMEHGCYETPECVPYQYQDEEDYYDEHEKIVDKVVACRIKLRNLIAKVRDERKSE